MDKSITEVWVYAHWLGMSEPKCIGKLSANFGVGSNIFSFNYDDGWIKSQEQLILDPDLEWYSGSQYPKGKANFGIILDSMPDAWGRTLLRRREVEKSKKEGRGSRVLTDIDLLLGVFDECRMGAFRFKVDPNGPFLDMESGTNIPPSTSLKELQDAVKVIEGETKNKDIDKWIKMLVAPGASLGGVRPKANFYNKDGSLWIAKFPSRNDKIDKAAWEYLAYRLARNIGIKMAPSIISIISGDFNSFLTKRFDRVNMDRIHFASAMTMTGFDEEKMKKQQPSYLDIAEFIRFAGANIEEDLKQLWTRIVFNISISNTDDHLKNHGFLLTDKGWILSPAFDVNPSIESMGLALNIDDKSNVLDFDLAKEVGVQFRLNNSEMSEIIQTTKKVVRKWRRQASEIGISSYDQGLMEPAFKY